MNLIANLTDEERAEFLARAHQARRDKIAAWQLDSWQLKMDFKDLPQWRRLASKFKVRMPAMYIPGSELKYARKALRATGLDFNEYSGCTIKQFVNMNPTWPAAAVVGVILEAGAELHHVEFEEVLTTELADVEIVGSYDEIDDLV